MNNNLNRLSLLRHVLMQGLLVNWAHSFVVILVISALFSTPLILGSIKNRVYVAVKNQVEKENNAREITIQQTENVPLNHEFLKDLSSKYPYQIIGNLKSIVMVEGTGGAQIQTIQTLVPDDPRTDALQITPKISTEFGLFEVVVSDQLGELLYGKEQWYELWDNTQFKGMPMRLSLNDIPLSGDFQIVSRQKVPGRKIYASEELGICLKKYSIGLGCEEVGLPMVPDQVQYSLPNFETMQCVIEFPNSQCDSEQQTKIVKRLKAENFKVEEMPNVLTDINKFQVTLQTFNENNGQVEPNKGDCEQRLYHHFQNCPYVAITPKISLPVDLVQFETTQTIQLSGISPPSYDFLPGIEEMINQWGGKRLDFWTEGLSEDGVEIVAPYNAKTPLGMASLQLAGLSIPAFIIAYYQCPEGMDCPFYTKPKSVFRLQNIIDGAAIFKYDNYSPIFYPSEAQQRIDYDELLVFANAVEEVENLHGQLVKALPGYNVQYNIYAIDKLKRQDQRLSTLFNLTVWLSVVFILLAVGALAKINVDRRQREMAQLFILGYPKSFVGLMLVCEYVLLTVLASIFAIGVGWGVFAIARYYLQSTIETTTEFATIVNAMTLDLSAFSSVFIIVIIVTTVVAAVAAYLASKSDPVELLY